jgi:integrase
MARPRTGQLIWRVSGWHARITTVVDGERVRVCRPLGTTNKAVANRRLSALLDADAPPDASQSAAQESVAAYAEAWLAAREARGLPTAQNERRYWTRVWKPVLGRLELDAVRASHIQVVLDDAASGQIATVRGRRYSRESICHMRATVLRMLQSAWREELVSENRAARTTVPDLEENKKPRAILTDEEVGKLVGHPDVDPEIKLLVLLARTIGGMRTGDLNTLDWGAFSPDFATCTFVRRKTRKKRSVPQTLAVPEAVRPFIDAWWRCHGQPASGPVFPVRRGTRAGQEKKQSKQSYAIRLRRELLTAGISRPELHAETATTRPVHFHATRAAYASALARIGTNAQTAMVLTGHSDARTHQRYVDRIAVQSLPSAAVPALDARAAATVTAASLPKRRTKGKRPVVKPAVFSEREKGFEPSTSTLARSRRG